MSVAFGDEDAVGVQAGQCRQVGFLLAQEKLLDVGDLGKRGGVTAGDVEHPVVAELIGCAGQQPGDVVRVKQQAEVAAEQVFRRPGWPALADGNPQPSHTGAPGTFQACRSEVCAGSSLQFFVAQDVHRQGRSGAATGWHGQ